MSENTTSASAEESIKSPYKDIWLNGLWKQNAGLVQLLGLCPVLAVSSTIVNGISLGLATTLVTVLSGMVIASVRQYIPQNIRNPIFILIIASLVTCVDLAMNAWLHALYQVLGIFIPLITTNCIVMARAEAFASKNDTKSSLLDGFAMGIGLTLVLGALGCVRELLGKGTLLSGLDLIFGPSAQIFVLHIIPENFHYQFLLALLPPGAFMGLALLIAARNWYEQKKA